MTTLSQRAFGASMFPAFAGVCRNGPVFAPDDGTGAPDPSSHVDPDAPVEIADKPREPTTYEKALRTKLSNAARRAEDAERKLAESTTKAKADTDKALADVRAEADGKVAAVRKGFEDSLKRAELLATSAAAGLAHPDFLKLVDTSKVTVGDDGKVEVPATFWADVKAALPHLFGSATGADRGTTSSTQTPPKPVPATGKKAKDMSADEFKAAMRRIERGELP